jgi:hypothetical protein
MRMNTTKKVSRFIMMTIVLPLLLWVLLVSFVVETWEEDYNTTWDIYEAIVDSLLFRG